MEGKKVLCVGDSSPMLQALKSAGISVVEASESLTAFGKTLTKLNSVLYFDPFKVFDTIKISGAKLPRKLKKRLYETRAMRRKADENRD